MSASHMPSPRPATGFIRIGKDLRAWIAGYRCPDCGAVALQMTLACRHCSSRKPLQEFRAAERGSIYSWTVVERSYPGIPVPFVSVIVDLDDGLSLKGTLRGADRDSVRAGMPVSLAFDDAGGAVDADGAAYIGYHFTPLAGEKS